MEQAQRAEARDGGGIGDSPSLQISEIRRDANAAIEDRGVEIALGDPLEVGEHHGEQLRGGERPVLPEIPGVDEREAVGALGDAEREGGEVALQLRVGEGAAEEALDLGDGVPRVHGGGRGPRGADEALLVAEADDGGGLPLGLLVEHHVDAPLPRHRDDAALIADVEPHHAHPRYSLPSLSLDLHGYQHKSSTQRRRRMESTPPPGGADAAVAAAAARRGGVARKAAGQAEEEAISRQYRQSRLSGWAVLGSLSLWAGPNEFGNRNYVMRLLIRAWLGNPSHKKIRRGF